MSESRIKNSTRNIFFGTIKYVVSILFPFIIRTILIYKLGAEYAGITSLFSSILQVLNLSELGFSTAVVYALYEPVAKGDNNRVCALLTFFRKVYKFCGIFILIVGLLVCPFAKHLIRGSYPSDINIYIVFVLLLTNTAISYLFCGYKSVLFAAHQRDDILSKAQILSNLVLYLLQIVSLLLLSNYYAYITCMILGTLLNNFSLYYFSGRMYPEITCHGNIEKQEQINLVKSVGALFGHQLDAVVITSVDNIVISMFIGLNILAIYNNYYYILNALLNVLIMISNSFAGSIGNSIAVESKEKNFKNFIDFTYLIGTLSAICTILMFVLYQDFMKIWMGESMLFSIDMVFLLSLSFYARQFRRSVITYKIAAGIWRKDALKPYVAAITNLILNIIFVQKIGINGIVLSTIISLIIIEIPWETKVLFDEYFHEGLAKYFMTQGKIIFKMVFIGLFTYFLSSLYPTKVLGLFIIKAIILSLVVVFFFILVSFMDDEFKYMTSLLKKIIKKK